MHQAYDKKCPQCELGVLVKRHGKYGDFIGCNQYPSCSYTKKMSKAPHSRYKNTNEQWINASDIGAVTFCSQSFYLKYNGVEPTAQAVARMQKGNRKHAKVGAAKAVSNRKRYRRYQSSNACYIATYAFGEDHPVVDGLRIWRDDVLMVTWYGRLFVKCYYAISPKIIAICGRSNMFHVCAKRLIMMIASWIGVK